MTLFRPALVAGFLLSAWPALAVDSDGSLPDPALTPGVARTTSKAVICSGKSTKDERHVTGAMKEDVRRRYGLTNDRDKWCNTEEKCEIDHLISLELGGANDINNLWPEAYSGLDWTAHDKDKLENRLHKLICSGKISVEDAQHEISTDWIASYKKHIGPKQ